MVHMVQSIRGTGIAVVVLAVTDIEVVSSLIGAVLHSTHALEHTLLTEVRIRTVAGQTQPSRVIPIGSRRIAVVVQPVAQVKIVPGVVIADLVTGQSLGYTDVNTFLAQIRV